MDIDDMNAFLQSVCEGQKYERFIDGYSQDIENYLKACGYIRIEGEGVFKKIVATDRARMLYAHGGFAKPERPNPIGFTRDSNLSVT